MEQYDIDHKIIFAIGQGSHNFEKIWNYVGKSQNKNDKIGSRTTLSKHLTRLVNAGYLRKDGKNIHTRYHLERETNEEFVSSNELDKIFNEEISSLIKTSKKLSDEQLLKEFIQSTRELLIVSAKYNFQKLNLLYSYKNEGHDHVQPHIVLIDKRLELINKTIMARTDILKKREGKLNSIFFESIQNNLDYLNRK